MRTLHISPDPDSLDPREETARAVTLPAAWEDAAAQALAFLTPTEGGPVRLTAEAARWVDAIDAAPRVPGTPAEAPATGRSLSCLLLMRHMAPNAALWQRLPDEQPGFVVRLSGFAQEGVFAAEAFAACLQLACDSLRRLDLDDGNGRSGDLPLFAGLEDGLVNAASPRPPAGIVLLTDLDACLAELGMDYDSDEARQFACAVAALARQIARAGTRESTKENTQEKEDAFFRSPAFPDIERLARTLAIREGVGREREAHPLALVETGFAAPGPIDTLLGGEACGLAPIFSPVDENGRLRPSTLVRLAHRGFSSETALARALEGENPLPATPPGAHAKMQAALAPFCDSLPPLPAPEMEEVLTRLERGVRRALPARHTGFSQRASIGGHSLVMCTSDFADGTLGALTLVPPRESPMTRGLMACLAQAVSLGLQYGAPLEVFVEQFAYTRFGPCGTVKGDPEVAYASSMLDYAFRALSEAYLGRSLADAPQEAAEDEAPMLPFAADSLAPERKTRASKAAPSSADRPKDGKTRKRPPRSLRLVG